MKMYLGDRHTVHMAFRLRNQTKYRQNILSDPFGNRQAFHDMPDLAHSAVMMMLMHAALVMVLMHFAVSVFVRAVMMMFMRAVMVMFMRVPAAMQLLRLLRTVHPHRHMGAADSTLAYRLTYKRNTGNPQSVQFPKRLLPLRQKLQQRGGQHISRRPHATVQI